MPHKLYIEGIRGIAVLAVVFFHAHIQFFEGGYLGVDIFFVLSGFLILNSIKNSIDNKSFSFIHFLKKRFYRIIPAAIVTIVITVLIGKYIFFPEELINLYQSIYYIILLQSNVLAAHSIDYFGLGVDFQPLVHYWSLSIELQFYIIFPFIVIFFLKYRSEKSLLIFLSIILFLSISYATLDTNLNNNEKYFSSLMRIWEFMLGAIVFLISKIYAINIYKQEFITHLLSSVGLIAVLISLTIFNESFNVPGYITLIPTIGVSLLLLFANDSSFIGRLLSVYPLRYIGIISFSLYLVHQPIFALSRTIIDRNFDLSESIGLIIISITLGNLLWMSIEKPFQNRKYRNILILAITIALFFISQDGKDMKKEILVQNQKIKQYLSYRYDNNPRYKECRITNKIINPINACRYGAKNKPSSIVLWGDSHMDQIAKPLSRELNQYGFKVVEFPVLGCPPIIDMDLSNGTRKCKENNNVILKYILDNNNIKDVVFFAYWNYYIGKNRIVYSGKQNFRGKHEIQLAFEKTVDLIIQKNKRVHIIYPAPQMKVNPPLHKARLEKIFKSHSNNIIRISKEEYMKQSHKSIKLLDTIANEYPINKINISDLLQEGNFYVANNVTTIFYRDDNHLSTSGGGEKVAKDISLDIIKFIKHKLK